MMEKLARFFDQLAFGLYELRSLALQEEMARWSLGTLLVSGAATLISAFALYGLFQSLSHTRKALELSRDVGHAQVRAYVGIEEGENTIRNMDIEANPLSVTLQAKNYGDTPTAGFRYAAAVLVRTKPYPKKNDRILPISDGIIPSSPLFPGNHVSIIAKLADDERDDFLQCLRGEHPSKSAFVSGCLQYEDVFGARHETLFCYEMVTQQIEGAEAALVRWTITPLQNYMAKFS